MKRIAIIVIGGLTFAAVVTPILWGVVFFFFGTDETLNYLKSHTPARVVSQVVKYILVVAGCMIVAKYEEKRKTSSKDPEVINAKDPQSGRRD